MTNYDSLLADGYERYEARAEINEQTAEVLNKWQASR